MDLKLLLLPLLGAFIGWFTNVLAIKLIFRPFKPFKLPIFNITIQGLIPKRQMEIAANVSEVIDEKLISINDFIVLFDNSDTKRKLIDYLIPTLKRDFQNRLPVYIPLRAKEAAAKLFEDVLKREIPSAVEKITSDFTDKAQYEIDIKKMIETKIKSFDVVKLEKLILELASKEFRLIRVLGAVLGLIVGVAQLLFIYFTAVI